MGALWSLMMPYFIVLFLIAVIAFYAWSRLRKELAKLDAEEKKAAKVAPRKVKKKSEDVETLKKDPKTGVYRIDGE